MGKTDIRVGFGYDSHEFKPGVPLRIGGLHIEHPEGLAGHSDGDVLLHAITDALLGAAALGDIGVLPRLVELFLQGLRAVQRFLLRLPARGKLGRPLLEFGEFRFESF